MDFYLELVSYFLFELLNNSGLNCFWSRCLNTAIVGFEDKRTQKLDKIFKLDFVLPVWGLTAKVRTGFRGGRVLVLLATLLIAGDKTELLPLIL